MPNVFRNVRWITMEALRSLVNSLVISPYFNTDYNKEFKKAYKIGDSVEVRLPQRFLIRDGQAFSSQSLANQYVTVSVDQQFGVDFEYTSAEEALNLEDLATNYIQPAMLKMGDEIDSRCANHVLLNTPNVVGALGTNPTAYSTYLSAKQRMNEFSCPPGKKAMIVSPGMEVSLIGNNTNLAFFHAADELTRQFKEATMGRAMGFDWYTSNNLYTHTAGTWAGAVTVNGAGQSGSSLNVTGTSGDTFFRGDKIRVAAVNGVNPMNRRSTGTLKQFVVTAALTLSGTTGTVSIYPSIVGPGDAYQNVDALPATGAALTLWPGTGSPNGAVGRLGAALHRDAFALVGVPLSTPKAVEIGEQQRDRASGVSIRITKTWDAVNDRDILRIETLLGIGTLYGDSCACLVASST